MKTKFEEVKFEITLADGRTRRFASGEDLYDWVKSVRECKSWRFEERQEKDSTNSTTT